MAEYLPQIIKSLSIVTATFMLQVVLAKILNLYYKYIANRTKTQFDDDVIPLIKRILLIGLWVGCLFLLALQYDVNISGIAATAGVMSLLITVAIKQNVINIIAGITIMIDKPFQIGDTIKIPSGEKGIVKDIGIRRTKILITDSDTKAMLIMQNADLSKCKIVNYSNV